jgi:predicted dehydrogenase
MADVRKIKWGILGTSWISSVMAEAIQASDTSELVAIGSRDAGRAIKFAKKHNIKKYYADYLKLLSDPDIDAVYIGLPNHLHKEWIIRCAEARKHILCEKPFVLNIQEAEEALSAIKEHHVFCMEALMYHCHPFIKYLQDLTESKIVGDIKSISAAYTVNIFDKENKTAGGAIRNLGCYPLSLVRLLAKEEPEKILALGQLDASLTSDHVSIAVCRFKNGMTATITAANNLDWWWQFTIFGTKGILNVITNPWLPGNNNQIIIKIGEKEEVLNFNADKPLYTYQIECVANHINKGLLSPIAPGISWEHSFGNVAMMDHWLTQVKINPMKQHASLSKLKTEQPILLPENKKKLSAEKIDHFKETKLDAETLKNHGLFSSQADVPTNNQSTTISTYKDQVLLAKL